MSDPKSVSVEIFGQRYPIRSALDAEYVKRLATFVDGKIRAAGDSAPSGDPVRLASSLYNLYDTAHYRERITSLLDDLEARANPPGTFPAFKPKY